MENNTNFQTFHQMGAAINDFVKQATGRDNVQNINIDHITVAQNHYYEDVDVSGSVVSFHAGAAGLPLEKCVVQIEPVQDLHGYDHPWPGGATKNLFPYPQISGSGTILTKQPVKIPAGSYVVSCVRDQTNQNYISFTFYDENDSSCGSTTLYMANNNAVALTLTADAATVTAYANETISISNIQIESGSSASSYIPYENICPITGWTGAKVTRTGKNLCGGLALGQAIVDAVNSPTNTYLGNDSDGNYVTFAAGFILENKIVFTNFKPNKQYTFILKTRKENTNSTNLNITVMYSDGTERMLIAHSPAVLQTEAFVTDVNKTVATLELGFGGSRTFLYYEESGIFEGVLTVEDFEPYTRQTYDITFPSEAGTVYGGTLDVTSGVLTVDRAIVDLGTLEWDAQDIGGGVIIFRCTIPDFKPVGYTEIAKMICSQYIVVSQSAVRDLDKSISSRDSTVAGVRVHDSSYTDATTFKTAMSGVQLVYELATPITYTFTPQEVITLLGLNHIWADTGDIEVKFADLKELY